MISAAPMLVHRAGRGRAPDKARIDRGRVYGLRTLHALLRRRRPGRGDRGSVAAGSTASPHRRRRRSCARRGGAEFRCQCQHGRNPSRRGVAPAARRKRQHGRQSLGRGNAMQFRVGGLRPWRRRRGARRTLPFRLASMAASSRGERRARERRASSTMGGTIEHSIETGAAVTQAAAQGALAQFRDGAQRTGAASRSKLLDALQSDKKILVLVT